MPCYLKSGLKHSTAAIRNWLLTSSRVNFNFRQKQDLQPREMIEIPTCFLYHTRADRGRAFYPKCIIP